MDYQELIKCSHYHFSELCQDILVLAGLAQDITLVYDIYTAPSLMPLQLQQITTEGLNTEGT